MMGRVNLTMGRVTLPPLYPLPKNTPQVDVYISFYGGPYPFPKIRPKLMSISVFTVLGPYQAPHIGFTYRLPKSRICYYLRYLGPIRLPM